MRSNDIFRSSQLIAELNGDALRYAWANTRSQMELLRGALWGGEATEEAVAVLAEEVQRSIGEGDDLIGTLADLGLVGLWTRALELGENGDDNDQLAAARLARLVKKLGAEVEGTLHAALCAHTDPETCAAATIGYYETALAERRLGVKALTNILMGEDRHRRHLGEAALRRSAETDDPETSWAWWWAAIVAGTGEVARDRDTHRRLWEVHAEKSEEVLRGAAGSSFEEAWPHLSDYVARLGPDHWGRLSGEMAYSTTPAAAADIAARAARTRGQDLDEADWEGAAHLWRPESIEWVLDAWLDEETLVETATLELAVKLSDDLAKLQAVAGIGGTRIRDLTIGRIVEVNVDWAAEHLGLDALGRLIHRPAIRERLAGAINRDPATALELLSSWQGSLRAWIDTVEA